MIQPADVPPVATSDDVAAWMSGDRPTGLSHTDLLAADVRWYLDGRSGRDAYLERRLPGAVWIDLDQDLVRTNGVPTDGRHPLPTPESFAAAMTRRGIGDNSLVVAYDDTGGSTAGRLVLMLRWLGRLACLLDGGIDAWRGPMRHGHHDANGEDAAPHHRPFTPTPWPTGATVTADEVAAAAADPRRLVIDARSHERYTGEVALVDRRPGHVPGAHSAPWVANLDPASGRLREVGQLASQYRSLGADTATEVIAYCGSGVSACLDVLAMEHAGFRRPRLYVASWSGWSADPLRPAALGNEQ